VKLLFLSDTHLGFDYPFRPRIERRRRGPDFFRMFELALLPALNGEVDAVVHGGDILFRSKVPPLLVQMAFEPLFKVAQMGVPVYLVPGNHERSQIPYRLLASHPNIHIFVRPKTFYLEVGGFTLALAGFPYVADNVRQNFLHALQETRWQEKPCDAVVLCIHHCVEGSAIQMGNRVHVFRDNNDVVRIREFPSGLAAVLSGHIHRFQVLTRDLRGQPVAVPVFYPGSTERTSFVEKDEEKGYLILELERAGAGFPGGKVKGWQFNRLPARPMKVLEVQAGQWRASVLVDWIKSSLAGLAVDSVVKINFSGTLSPACLQIVRAESLRELVPQSMNVSVNLVDMSRLFP